MAKEVVVVPGTDARGTRVTDVVDDKGGLIARIGHYHDTDLTQPKGFAGLMGFLPTYLKQYDKGKWSAFYLDSCSFANLLARKWHQYDLNEDSKDPRQWYGGAVDLMEEMLCVQLPALPGHVAIVMHESKRMIDDGEGGMVKSPNMPGKRLLETQMISGAWPEMYRMYIARDAEGNKIRRLLTDCDEQWQAGTVLGVTDACKATWANIAKHLPPDQDWHAVIYGQPYIGKSTLLADMARTLHAQGKPPVYVASFDGKGKDVPYKRLGTAVVPELGKKKGKEGK